ncbi:MAG: 2-oxoacid:acceptor oxidoreductase family protein [Alkaliphilus sp.]
MSNNLSIRMSGLGGQGVVTAANILGGALVRAGKQSTVNPFFGAEKRLAPAESYVRVSDEKIYERGEIIYPDIIMIYHPHVITLGKSYTMPFYDGLKENGIIIINSNEELPMTDEDIEKLKEIGARIYYIPATTIAIETAGTELSTNMAMLGALLEVTNLVSMDFIKASLEERFGGKKFIASGSTAALDDAMKGKFEKISQLIQKNMEIVEVSGVKTKKYSLEKGRV